MRSFIRFALRALVLIVVALISALMTMRYAIHGQEVAVPNLVDKPPSEARRISEENGFRLAIERQYYSSTVAAGKILSQAPAPGTKVRRGWEIRVAQSEGPQRVQIPTVIGESERAAEMNLKRRGLDLSAVAELPWPADLSDQVLAQSPPPNAKDVAAPKINLLIATPPPPQAFLMPSFVGQQLGTVTAALRDAGLRVGTVTPSANAANGSLNPDTTSPAGIVTSQTPRAGEKISLGATVNFEVRP